LARTMLSSLMEFGMTARHSRAFGEAFYAFARVKTTSFINPLTSE